MLLFASRILRRYWSTFCAPPLNATPVQATRPSPTSTRRPGQPTTTTTAVTHPPPPVSVLLGDSHLHPLSLLPPPRDWASPRSPRCRSRPCLRRLSTTIKTPSELTKLEGFVCSSYQLGGSQEIPINKPAHVAGEVLEKVGIGELH